MENKTFSSVQHDPSGKSQTCHHKSVTVNMGKNINKPYFKIPAFVILASDCISDQRLLSGPILLLLPKFTSNEDPD